VGRLVKRKGLAHFLERIFPRILERSPRTLLLVAGEGPERRHCEGIIRARVLRGSVHFFGEMAEDRQAELHRLYRAANCLVFPNRRLSGDPEGFGLVAVEAAAHGLPVVASRVDSLPEVVSHGESGLLVDSPEELGDAVLEILGAGPAERRRWEAGCSAWARRQPAWGETARRIAAFMELSP
jgi:phosphatidylinositol alpha-1,6-mannosyltransferase